MQGRLEVPACLAAACMFPAFLAPNYTRSELLQQRLPNIFTFCFYHPTGATTGDTGAKRRNEEVTLPFHRAWPCKAHTWCYPGAVIGLPGAEPSNTHSDITAWWMERLSPTISSTEEVSAFCTPHSSTPSSSHSPAHTSQDISLNTFGMSDKLRTQVFVSLVTAGHLHF